MSHMKNIIVTLVDALTDRDAYMASEQSYDDLAANDTLQLLDLLEDIADAAEALVEALIAPPEPPTETITEADMSDAEWEAIADREADDDLEYMAEAGRWL